MPNESFLHYPAVSSRGKCYLIDDTTVIGKVRVASALGTSSGIYERVCLTPDDEMTAEFFCCRRMFDGKWELIHIRYDGLTGNPLDDDFKYAGDDRFKTTRIVDVLDFDVGIAHPSFAGVLGYGSYRTEQRKLKINTKHRSRRPRNSHKIKKVGVA